jgi:hypothetical protein
MSLTSMPSERNHHPLKQKYPRMCVWEDSNPVHGRHSGTPLGTLFTFLLPGSLCSMDVETHLPSIYYDLFLLKIWKCYPNLYNIIQSHNNVLSKWQYCIMHNILHIQTKAEEYSLDWQYFVEYSSHLVWMWKIFYIILPVPQNTLVALNNVMFIFY